MVPNKSMKQNIETLSTILSPIIDREFDVFWSKTFDSLRMIDRFDRCMPVTLIREVKMNDSEDTKFERIRFYSQGSTISPGSSVIDAYSGHLDVKVRIGHTTMDPTFVAALVLTANDLVFRILEEATRRRSAEIRNAAQNS